MDTKLAESLAAKFTKVGDVAKWEQFNISFVNDVKGKIQHGLAIAILRCGIHFEANSHGGDLFGKLFTGLMQVGDKSMADKVKDIAYHVWGVSIRVNKKDLTVSYDSNRKRYDEVDTIERERMMTLLNNGGINNLLGEIKASKKQASKTKSPVSKQTQAINKAMTSIVEAYGDGDEMVSVFMGKLAKLEADMLEYLRTKTVRGLFDANLGGDTAEDNGAEEDATEYKLASNG